MTHREKALMDMELSARDSSTSISILAGKWVGKGAVQQIINDLCNAYETNYINVGSCEKCKHWRNINCPVYQTEDTDSDFPEYNWYCAYFKPIGEE